MRGLHDHLLQLTYIRLAIMAGLCAAMLFATYLLHADIKFWLAIATLGVMALLNLGTYLRLHSPWPVTDLELFLQLLIDALIYALLLYQTGGSTNPFIFCLLLPIIISASTLSWRYTWMLSLLVIGLYSLLLHFFIPILQPDGRHHHSLVHLFQLHIDGMWLNFILTVLLITWFVVHMQRTLRAQEQHLQSEREQRIQDQQLISLATMAAGTAHELGTPLATMSVVLNDMKLDHPDDAQLQEDIALLQQQVSACSQRLHHMSNSVRDDQEKCTAVTDLIDQVIDQWQLMRPDVTFTLEEPTSEPAPQVAGGTSLRQALLNLLNNAADACPKEIDINLTWDHRQIWLRIHDHGPGLKLEQTADLGKPFMTTKGKGLGIGLFLTVTTLALRDGDVRLYNHPSGGTLTEVRLPIYRNDSTHQQGLNSGDQTA